MALLNIVGFETGDAFELRTGAVGGTASIQSTVKRTGGFAFRCNPATTATGFGRISGYATTGSYTTFSEATLHARFYFRYATKPGANSEELCSFFGAAQKLAIRIDSSGNLSAWDGTTQLGSTGSTVLSADTWYMIGVTCGTGTNAAWALTIDGAAEISGTRTFTSNSNNVELELGKLTNRNGQTVDFFYDDVALSNTAIPGAGAVVMAKADGNGNYTAWTGDYTPEWTEAPPITTDDASATQYVATSTNTNAESATMESSATIGASGTINAVKTLAIVKQGASALCKIRLRSGTTDDDTSGVAPGTSYVSIGKVYEADPADAAAWTTTKVDAVEVGVVHAQSQVRELRCTAVFLVVEYTPSGSSTPQAIDATAVGVATLTRVVIFKRTLTASAVGVPTLARQLSFFRTLTASAVGVPTVTKITSRFRELTAAAVGVSSISKLMSSTLSATAVGVTTITSALSFSALLEAVSIGVASLTILKMYQRTLEVVATGVVSIQKLVSKTLSTTAVGVSTMQRLTSKTITAVAVGVTTITDVIVLSSTLTVIAVGVVTLATQLTVGAGAVVRRLIIFFRDSKKFFTRSN
jgi:hypothetical protein